ncbi:hypothetical protein BGX28_003919 [Mortierella sp. GBA30]|nr:hypothetical protein BGX28_003919 [Mortierella sp. GBA30]
MPPLEIQQEVLPIQLPIQPLNMSRRRVSRVTARSDIEAAAYGGSASGHSVALVTDISVERSSKPAAGATSITGSSFGPSDETHVSPLTWISRVITKAAEFYCTVSSPCFALPILLYADPSFRWSAPEIHTTHFAIFLSVLTALTSTLYHATLYKVFSSLDACFATIMFYINTIHLLRSLPDPYAMLIPDLISTVVHSNWTPYLLTTGMMTLFIFSWKKTAMLSLLLMVVMIPASIWGFVAHESWMGLGFGLVGLAMFAADRFKFFCGHSYWHLAGGLSLWYGIASGALAK